ncbi:hypothetical protein ANN_16961 [Periplaneta americana]|uniref:BTB domain-containing protein n=1 Tax=Periplaneta americana TaxID=6978 RepID=A0ABQ8SRK6_PERAM|nr:hypothetical protein ANN_16961 [Periplaneta americana]
MAKGKLFLDPRSHPSKFERQLPQETWGAHILSKSPTGTPKLHKMDASELQVRWQHHQVGVLDYLKQLLVSEVFVDVTLCCQDKRFKAHRLLLSACSSYLQVIFTVLGYSASPYDERVVERRKILSSFDDAEYLNGNIICTSQFRNFIYICKRFCKWLYYEFHIIDNE